MKKVPPKNTGKASLRESIMELHCRKMSQETVVSLEAFRQTRIQSKGKTILVVDQDEVAREGMRRFLEGESYKVELADDAISLSQVIELNSLDMIFLDIDLPWVNGAELCALLRSHPSLATIPIVLTSASPSQSQLERGFASGCNDFIAKPYSASVMSGLIDKLLS